VKKRQAPPACNHDKPWLCAFNDEIAWRSWEPAGLGGVGVLLDATIRVRCGPFDPTRGGPADLNHASDDAARLLGVNEPEWVDHERPRAPGEKRRTWPATSWVTLPLDEGPRVEVREAANPETALDRAVAAARGSVAGYYLARHEACRSAESAPATRWPPELGWVMRRLDGLRACDLPPAPWAIRESQTKVIGLGIAFGGPVETVTDTAAWLAALQRDVREGAAGARYKTGAIFADLHALARGLRETTPGLSFGF